MSRILAVCGSLRAQSTNLAVLEAARALAPEGMSIALYPDLGRLPHYNPDLDGEDVPALVAALRRTVGASDALLICSPEYARGIAGSLKNGLDWLVGSLDFPGKPVAVINASPRSTHADAALKLTLSTMSARLVEPACITLPLLGRSLGASAIAADPALSAALRAALGSLAAAISSA